MFRKTELLKVFVPLLPPSVNSYVRHTRSGIHYKTAKTLEFERTFTAALKEAYKGAEAQTGKLAVSVVFMRKYKIRFDLDNRLKSVLDCLQMADIIADDALIAEIHAEKIQPSQADGTELTLYTLS